MERYLELKKCCGIYPHIRSREDGSKRIVCSRCGNATEWYLSSGLSANKGWNEMLDKQCKRLDGEE